MRFALTISLLALCSMLSAATAPDHPGNLEYRKGDPTISLDRFQGKITIILFSQSWCGVCNEWSPQLIEQMDKAYGGDHRFALVAAKTDGGGLKFAEEYLTERLVNLDHWYIASDEGRQWYKAYDAKTPLFGLAVVGPNGGLIEYGKAGMKFGNGVFTIAGKKGKLLKKYGESLTTVLPNKERPKETAATVKAIEARDFMSAYMSLQTVKGDAGSVLREELDGLITAKSDQLAASIEEKTGDLRFLAFAELRDLCLQLKGHPPSKTPPSVSVAGPARMI